MRTFINILAIIASFCACCASFFIMMCNYGTRIALFWGVICGISFLVTIYCTLAMIEERENKSYADYMRDLNV